MKKAFCELVALVVLITVAVGCRTLPSADVASFSTGVTQAKQHTAQAFKTINDLARDDLVDFAAKQANLNDKIFVILLDRESIAAWERGFAALESYAHHLAILTAPSLTDEYRANALKLAEQIKSTGKALEKATLVPSAPDVSAPIAAGFTKLGDLLIRAKAQAKARSILQEADPEVQRLFANMAEVIGSSSSEGLRATMAAHWRQRKGEKQVAFLKETDFAARRDIVVAFLGLLYQQDTHDAILASTERSLRALAAAHNGLSLGKALTVSSAVDLIKSEIADTKELLKEFKTAEKKQRGER